MTKKELKREIEFRTGLIGNDIKNSYGNNLDYDIKELKKLRVKLAKEFNHE